MNKELKTLKELDESSRHTESFSHHAHLKQEAIKWIEDLEKSSELKYVSEEYEQFIHHESLGFRGDSVNDPNYVINWIKHFFNITEEDLKEIQFFGWFN